MAGICEPLTSKAHEEKRVKQFFAIRSLS